MWRKGNRNMTSQHIISSSPDVVSGTPVFTGTRVPVKNLFDYMQGGEALTPFWMIFLLFSASKLLKF